MKNKGCVLENPLLLCKQQYNNRPHSCLTKKTYIFTAVSKT